VGEAAPGCEHWTVGDHRACGAASVVIVTCSGGGETWTGPLCAEHLADYRADEEIAVRSVRSVS